MTHSRIRPDFDVDPFNAADDNWPVHYALWEMDLLDGLGYGLDLSDCAVSGATGDLVWVSPKTGRAVSRSAGADWRHRLLPLPPFLRDATTQARDRPVPEARARLLAALKRKQARE